MDYSKTQMSSLSEEGGSGLAAQASPARMKLDVMMEHLQRQQEAKMEMDLHEKHIRQAQLLFAQHAAAARAFGSRLDSPLFSKAAAADGSRSEKEAVKEEEDSDVGEDEEDIGEPDENGDADEEEDDNRPQRKKPRVEHSVTFSRLPPHLSTSPPVTMKQEPDEKERLSPGDQQAFTSPNGFSDWGYDEPFKQLYEIDTDPQRKEFLDELFVFMQKRGTPVNRIPIMAKQVLDLYKLYKLVTEKGGLVEVINKKNWREITKGLSLPTSITSAAFTLRTQYMKYLYPLECEKKGLSSLGELQAAIDGNRREGRRPSYTSSLYHYSPSPSSGPGHSLLSSPKLQTPQTGHNGLNPSISPSVKRHKDEASNLVLPSRMPMALSIGQHQHQLAQAATLEHLREKLERAAGGAAADGPDKKLMRLAEEQQRLMQQALQQNLLAMASHFNPMNLKLNNGHKSKQDLSLSISTNGAASISMSVEVNGTIYSGTLFAQKSPAPVPSQTVTLAGTSGFSALSSSHSPSSSSSSSSSSKGPN
ncbi:AT-rich interactive domain-containing protein 3A-like isoform X2 [Genypterus blacodes]|uniref:AT-rich interactive domain-containing protein 3A-like isoform X2 n=1 Tax=Genypterus blacodes TaxID=154954 RepID=UPI003F776F32